FRSDDYPQVILQKLQWCLDYARRERLVPILLGDLFHYPRDNANWLLSTLLEMLDYTVLAIYGNHDCYTQSELTRDDSLHVLASAGRLRLLNPDAPWRGRICDRTVIVGGTPWGRSLPERFDGHVDHATPGASGPNDQAPLVFWLAHHDLA